MRCQPTMQRSNGPARMLAPVMLKPEAPLPQRLRLSASLIGPQPTDHIAVDVGDVVRDARDDRLLGRDDRRVKHLSVAVEGQAPRSGKHGPPLLFANSLGVGLEGQFLAPGWRQF